MSPITTHVLDTARGRPAAGVAITLYRVADSGNTVELATGHTNADGRLTDLLDSSDLAAGTYRLSFDTASYFASLDVATFYPRVEITFTISEPTEHYHVPLLLSPFGYSTYRGS